MVSEFDSENSKSNAAQLSNELMFLNPSQLQFCHFLCLDTKKVTKEKSRKERLHRVPFIVP